MLALSALCSSEDEERVKAGDGVDKAATNSPAPATATSMEVGMRRRTIISSISPKRMHLERAPRRSGSEGKPASAFAAQASRIRRLRVSRRWRRHDPPRWADAVLLLVSPCPESRRITSL